MILHRRRMSRPLRSLGGLAGLLPASAAARLRRRASSLARKVGFEPERIVVRSVGRARSGALREVVEAVAVRDGGGVQVVARIRR